MLQHEDAHRRFYFEFQEDPCALHIGIYEPCVDTVFALANKLRDVLALMNQWGFSKSEFYPLRSFGFDNAITAIDTLDGYSVFLAPLTKNRTATSVSLSVLTRILSSFEVLAPVVTEEVPPADPRYLQLISVENGLTQEMMHAAPLYGYVAPAFANWLEGLADTEALAAATKSAMQCAWQALSGEDPDKYACYRFSAQFRENGAFFLNVPGDACDFSTVDWEHRHPDDGHKLSCHNLDSTLQQLSLLSGIAKMYDIARLDLDSKPPQ